MSPRSKSADPDKAKWPLTQRGHNRIIPRPLEFIAKLIVVEESHEVLWTGKKVIGAERSMTLNGKILKQSHVDDDTEIIDGEIVEEQSECPPGYLFINQASKYYHYAPGTLSELCRCKKVKAKKKGRRWMILEKSLIKYIRELRK